MTEKRQFILSKMIEHDWMSMYHTAEGTSRILEQMSRRISIENPLNRALEAFLMHEKHIISTFDEFFPRIKSLIDELVFADETQNGEEILVLNGGTFYCESTMKTKGFKPINSGDFETWYTFQTNNKTNNKTRKIKYN